MHHLSPAQLFRLTEQLLSAYNGDNKYAGDTAEIYAYTVMEADPYVYASCGKRPDELSSLVIQGVQRAQNQAARSLVRVCELFCGQHEDVCIEIDGLSLDDWFVQCGRRFGHRAHVRVFPTPTHRAHEQPDEVIHEEQEAVPGSEEEWALRDGKLTELNRLRK